MEIRTMPHDLDLERQVLQSCLAGDDAPYEVLKPDHFYNTHHANLYLAMNNLHQRQEPVEISLIAGELKQNMTSIPAAALSVVLDYPPAPDAALAARKIVGYYQLRELANACHAAMKRALSAGPDQPAEVSQYLKCELERIDAGRQSEWCHISDIITECTENAERLSKHGGITGVPTGFRDLDFYTCGYQGGDLNIIAARPSMGKTALAVNCMLNAAREGHGAGFISLEMQRVPVGNRALSIAASINALKFRSGRFVGTDWDKMVDAAGRLSDYPIWVDDHPRASYQTIHSKVKTLMQKHPQAKVVWIDYLGFIDGDKDKNKVQEVESITRNLKATAKELNIPINLLCQLSRKCEERPNKRPILSDLRDSGAIEQDADTVFFIYRDDYYNQQSKDKGITEVSISKQRNGPTGVVKLAWQEEYTRFTNLAKEVQQWQE